MRAALAIWTRRIRCRPEPVCPRRKGCSRVLRNKGCPDDFADSHCHLDFPELAEQRQDVLKRARGGVQRFLTIATHYSRHAGVQAIADQEADVWCSVGCIRITAPRRASRLRRKIC